MKTTHVLVRLISLCLFAGSSFLAQGLLAQGPDPEPLNFGSNYSADFNGDGIGDIAVGVPNEDIGTIQDAGAVQVFYGVADDCKAAIKDQLWHQNSDAIAGDSEEGDNFGAAMAVGDFNNDGFDDLAIGVPRESREYTIVLQNGTVLNARKLFIGMVHILYGSADGLTAQDNQFWDWNIFSTMREQENTFFGSALVSGDFDKDGYDDLAMGAPYLNPVSQAYPYSGNQGAVFTVYGSNVGLTSSEHQLTWTQEPLLGKQESNDQFGSSLAVGDFNNDGFYDLAVGVPFDNITGVSEEHKTYAGLVNVIYGSTSGLVTNNNQAWHQDSQYVPGEAQEYDHFGAALAVGDFDSDGFTDLAIGVPDEDIGTISNAGAVIVIHGSGNGLWGQGSRMWHQNSAGIAGAAEPNDHFGQALASGDVNGDYYSDLIVGVPNEKVSGFENAGAMHVIYGVSGGLSELNSKLWHHDSPDLARGVEVGDLFGAAISTGDFNGDLKSDIFAGAPGERFGPLEEAGALLVLFGETGSISGAEHKFLNQDSPGIEGAVENGDKFCTSIAIGKYVQGRGVTVIIQKRGEEVILGSKGGK